MSTSYEALEADFQRCYGLDLSDVIWGPDPISLRRLAALVRYIPADGAVGRELKDPDALKWGNTEELLANLIEVVDFGNRIFIQANTDKDTKPPEPISIPRPPHVKRETEEVPKKRPATAAEMKSFFGAPIYTPKKEE